MDSQQNDIGENPAPAIRTDWLWGAIPLVGLATIAFLVGMVVAIRQSPPFYTVRDAWIAYCALTEQQGLLDSKWPHHLWYPTDNNERGLAYSSLAESFGDYTLYTSADNCRATLVDLAGKEVHRWELPFRTTFPQAQHAPAWLPEPFILVRSAIPFANGDLLALYETIANTPSGCGLVKVDVEGRVLWRYDAHTHHDTAVGDDGRIYVLTNKLRRPASDEPVLASLSTVPLIEDSLTVLSADGKEIKSISLLDALVSSPYFEPLLIHVDRYGDITHNNTVNVVPAEFAARHPGVSAGDLMVCLRNLNLVAILNVETGKFVWATTGPWNHPHEPQPLANGNILVFDNLMVRGSQRSSAVVEFDPIKRETVWSYFGPEDRPLKSDTRGAVVQLPNDNVLITDTDRGRILEVNRQGEIVWEYVHPQRGGDNEEMVPVVCGAQRFTREELPFAEDLRRRTSANSVAAAIPQVTNKD